MGLNGSVVGNGGIGISFLGGAEVNEDLSSAISPLLLKFLSLAIIRMEHEDSVC